MSNKNLTMKQYNGTSYDTLYPETTIEQVTNLQSSLDSKTNKSDIKSISISVPAFTTSTTITGLTDVTADTVAVFGLAPTATAEQYKAAAKAQLLVTGQAAGQITITALAGSLTAAIPCVLNIFK